MISVVILGNHTIRGGAFLHASLEQDPDPAFALSRSHAVQIAGMATFIIYITVALEDCHCLTRSSFLTLLKRIGDQQKQTFARSAPVPDGSG